MLWLLLFAVIAFLSWFGIALTFDSGPDWFHSICFILMRMSIAAFIVGFLVLSGVAVMDLFGLAVTVK